jgi:DNA polymerase III delta subunit
MKLTVLLGDDEPGVAAERRRLLTAGGGEAEEIDVSSDGGVGLVAAVRTPSMFGSRVVSATGMEALSSESAQALAACAAESGAVVVAVAAKALPAKIRTQLVAIGEVRRIDQPRGAGVAKEVSRLSAEAGISLSAEGRALCGRYPIARVRGALGLLVEAGINSPSDLELGDALGGDLAETPPWKLTDAVMAGDLAMAVQLAEQVQPAVAVSVLTNQYRQLAVLVEQGTTDPDDAVELLGIKQRFVAEKLVRLARRMNQQQVYVALDALGELAMAVRSGVGGDALVLGVVELMSGQGS